jgi:Recombination directionality factor-like
MVAMTQPTSNGQTTSIVPRAQGQVAMPTILGRAAPRIPVGGRIRAGIMVLTRKAAESAKAREIYDKGVAAGKGFEQIEKEICAVVEGNAHPLTPKNVPYFTVRGEDFPNPEVARQIMEKFGEDRGEGMKLYRFPVVFPADAWQNVMPHEMVTWTASQKMYWSEYSEDGQTRYCKTYESVPVDGNGRKTVRIFGGRKVTLRPENNGRCDPESCAEYQAKKCNLSGRFIFYMPGINSLSAFELATNSFYAMQAAIEKFQTIGFMRGGRISGFLDGRHTPFYITKRLVEVSRIDDAGKATRVSQWLIELEAPIDVTALLRREDGLEALEMSAADAAAVLGGDGRPRSRDAAEGKQGPVVDVAETGEIVQRDAGAGEARNAGQPAGSGRGAAELHRGTVARAERPSGRAGDSTTGSASESADKDVAWLLDAAAALGVGRERYEQYAEKRWGKGWKVAAGGRKRALDEINGFEDNAKGFQDKVAGELEIWN